MKSSPSSNIIPISKLRANWLCMLIACVVSTANMQYGFDAAVIGGFQAMPGFLKIWGFVDKKQKIGYGIDPTFQQLIASLMTLGALLSSLLAGLFGRYFGRRTGIWVGVLLNLTGITIQISTRSKGVLYLGRLVLGASNGFLTTFSNIYTSEISPAHLRGVMVGFFAFWVNVGSIVGAVVNYYFSTVLDKRCFLVPLGLLYIVPTILGIGLFFVPESPRWLLYRGRREEGRSSLTRLRGDSIEEKFVDIEWAEMVRGMEEEQKDRDGVRWIDMFRGANLRRTIICYAAMACHAGSGTWFAISYGTYFLQIAGVDKPFQYTIMFVCIGALASLIGMYVVREHLGRRSAMISTIIACGLAMMIIGIAGQVQTPDNKRAVGKALIASSAIFSFFYNAGVGMISYPIGTEVVSSRLRAWTMGTGISLNYFLAWLVGFCSPYFINPNRLNWGVKYGWIWMASNFLAAIFFYYFLPETKNRSLEEIDEMFENRVGVKDFKLHHTQIAQKALEDLRGSQADNGSKITWTETGKGVVIQHVEEIERGGDR
ncbi:hypothetical protein HYFRA_00013937 [Hymenoscyphus fraxineus]|uniref:Major facilitator superfamily (MFS) profile domain-containing protein n=1 Tax=Hymenoscyphus fraxineus TaxID=746836 RepID=A0A9N9L8M0_9HELO|nr:hypothetical protein HYFRA_00013937 [Hymenoscyphus fraxineus]